MFASSLEEGKWERWMTENILHNTVMVDTGYYTVMEPPQNDTQGMIPNVNNGL